MNLWPHGSLLIDLYEYEKENSMQDDVDMGKYTSYIVVTECGEFPFEKELDAVNFMLDIGTGRLPIKIFCYGNKQASFTVDEAVNEYNKRIAHLVIDSIGQPKVFKVGVVWSMYGTYTITAFDEDEAIDKIWDSDTELPKDGEYLEDSLEIDFIDELFDGDIPF
jgi:hypothetical protein